MLPTTLRLDGQWQFYADECEQYTGYLPEHERFSDTIQLPGTTAQAGKGTPNPGRETGCLTERFPFAGNAWFRRTVRIPEGLRGKRMQLFLERTRITDLWVNGDHIGSQNSLCTPHIYDLSGYSACRDLMLIICVNNTRCPSRGGHMTSPDTQTNWNGITGKMELRFFDDNCITAVKALPDAAERSVTFRLQTAGAVRMLQAKGEWRSIDGTVQEIPPQVLTLERDENGSSFAVMKFRENVPLWDEYTPVIAALQLRPYGSQDVTEISFGMTDFRAAGTHFTAHGRTVMLRGKHDGMIFPLEGAAPTDVEGWIRVMKTAKVYGINHYRFHTCCPPDAAFTAADLLGIYMEPEIPFWGTISAPGDEGFDPAEQTYLIEEGRRILETFGSHPSFCMFSLGNELWGSPARIGEILRYYKRNEKRILFTQGCNNFQHYPNILPEDDYFVGVRLSHDRLIRGSYGACDIPYGHVQAERPSTMHSYDHFIQPGKSGISEAAADGVQEIEIQYGTGVKKVRVDQATAGLIPEIPVITHEIGQYVTYPDLDEIPKYTGVLEARNFEIFRERLEKAGMLSQAKEFFLCSGKLAVQCYKEEIEAALRSEYVAGFQLLDIQDFTGQGTALVGILNAFMENKGTVTPEEWRGFCSDSVLLGIFEDYCVTDRLHMRVKLRHLRPTAVFEPVKFTIERGQNVIRKGMLPVDVRGQGLYDLGEIDLELPPASSVHRLKVTLTLPHTENSYVLRQFPKQEMPALQSARGICITSSLTEAKAELAKGSSVLFLPSEVRDGIQGFYCADFWCYPMFRDISVSMGKEPPVGTLGLCIDKRHPAVKPFRTEQWSTPQWYDIVTHAELAVLDGTDIRPVVQMIDNFERNHKLALLFECRVGSGRLMVCTSRLSEIADRPEVPVFARALVDYVSSPAFQPTAVLSREKLDTLFHA